MNSAQFKAKIVTKHKWIVNNQIDVFSNDLCYCNHCNLCNQKITFMIKKSLQENILVNIKVYFCQTNCKEKYSKIN